MDHTALSDMGMASLGHRLKLLRAVWEVKKDQGIQVDEDEWKPAGERAQSPSIGIRIRSRRTRCPGRESPIRSG